MNPPASDPDRAGEPVVLPHQLGRNLTLAMGLYFLLMLPLLLGLLIWLAGIPASPAGGPATGPITVEQQLILVVIVAGALGSYIHAATSFSDYLGNRRLYTSWLWWYLLRPFVGSALAVIVYFCIRGGLMFMASGEDPQLFGLAAIAALTGMFSKQGTDKLAEVFDTMFRTEKGDQRKDKLEKPVPRIHSLQPDRVQAGVSEVTLEVRGENFAAGAVATLQDRPLATRFVSPTLLEASLTAADTESPGRYAVAVVNPGPDGAKSRPLDLHVMIQILPPAEAEVE